MLITCLFSLALASSCIKSQEKQHPKMSVRETKNTLLSIENCPAFVSNCENPINALVNACTAAQFENTSFYIECLSNEVYVVHITGLHGYAALWINHKECTCLLEYFAEDETYNFADLLGTFITEFESIEHHEEWYESLLSY